MLFALSLLAGAAVSNATAAALDADRASRHAVLTTHAEGAQIYQCKPGTDGALLWSFREPVATLMVDGETVGRHYAGPHWALDDGSLIQGKLIATAPGATSEDIPLLELAVIDSKGFGALNAATLIFRTDTHGGILSGACTTAGMLQAVAYSADYVFVK